MRPGKGPDGTPLIPYIQVHDLHIGPLTIHPFGLLVATGTLLGIWLATRRGRLIGLPPARLSSFISWMLVGGFIGGHVLDEVFYHPREVLVQPWSLLYLWAGLSSFGGFVGGLLGVVLWKYYEMKPAFHVGRWLSITRPVRRAVTLTLMPYCDVVLSVFPVAWVFGRLGCSVVHDHPGIVAHAVLPLAVAYGAGPLKAYGWFDLRFGDTPRYDLGTLEMLFAVLIAFLFAFNWNRRLPRGWYVAALLILYAPVRFGLDFLRLDDPAGGDLRYAGLTPAQWACIALFGVGVTLAARLQRQQRGRVETA